MTTKPSAAKLFPCLGRSPAERCRGRLLAPLQRRDSDFQVPPFLPGLKGFFKDSFTFLQIEMERLKGSLMGFKVPLRGRSALDGPRGVPSQRSWGALLASCRSALQAKGNMKAHCRALQTRGGYDSILFGACNPELLGSWFKSLAIKPEY